MAKVQTRPKIPAFFTSYFMLFVYAAVSVSLLFSTIVMAVKAFDTKEKAELAEIRYNEAIEQNSYLNEKISDMESLEGQEEILREEYRAMAPGEGLIIITDQYENIDEKKDKGFFERIFR